MRFNDDARRGRIFVRRRVMGDREREALAARSLGGGGGGLVLAGIPEEVRCHEVLIVAFSVQII